MNPRIATLFLLGPLLTVAALAQPATAWAVDADGAQMLARQSGCFKCHAVDKK